MGFFGSRFIFLSMVRSLCCFEPSVMKPFGPSFFPPPPFSLTGEEFSGVPPDVSILVGFEIVGTMLRAIAGPGCNSDISEFLRPFVRGEFSGVWSISLKAAKNKNILLFCNIKNLTNDNYKDKESLLKNQEFTKWTVKCDKVDRQRQI